MATIHDLREKFREATLNFELFGGPNKWRHDLSEKFKQVGKAIVEDTGLSREEAAKLPHDSKLGPKAEVAFQEFCELVDGKQNKSVE